MVFGGFLEQFYQNNLAKLVAGIYAIVYNNINTTQQRKQHAIHRTTTH